MYLECIILVQEELEVADVLLREKHGAEVVGRTEHLETRGASGGDVLRDGGIGVPRKEGMVVDVGLDAIGHRCSSIDNSAVGQRRSCGPLYRAVRSTRNLEQQRHVSLRFSAWLGHDT